MHIQIVIVALYMNIGISNCLTYISSSTISHDAYSITITLFSFHSMFLYKCFIYKYALCTLSNKINAGILLIVPYIAIDSDHDLRLDFDMVSVPVIVLSSAIS